MTEDRDSVDQDRIAAGRRLAATLFAGAPRDRPLPPEMVRHTMGHLFGDVWQDQRLPLEQRSMITCAVLAALGRDAELRLHLRGARNLGIERDSLEAMLVHVAHYAGWPAGATGLRLLDEVCETIDASPAP
jgi:alkylhydroperoxidase/carboxymuconolactone decarboxylase family protein YurZ